MDWHDHIVIDPKILVGKPVVKGTRLAVEFVVDLLANGWTTQQILDEYDQLTPDDIHACLAYAAEVLKLSHHFGWHAQRYSDGRGAGPNTGIFAMKFEQLVRNLYFTALDV
jgi:uncharacterized protein (DUF433 family)